MKVLKIILIFVAVICCIYVATHWTDIFHGSSAPVESTEYAAVEEKSDEIPTDKDQVRPFKDTEAAENAMKKADETKKQAAAAAEEAEKQAAAAAENAKRTFRELIVVNVIACNWDKVDELLKNKDYVTPAERTAICSFYWDGEKGASRPAPQQKRVNKAITKNSSKLKTIEDIVAFYRSDAIQNQVRPFKDTEAAENAMKKADETKKQAAAAAEEAEKQAAAAAENAKRTFREQIVVYVIACNWPKVDELLKNKDYVNYVTPAERIAISRFYWDGEKGAGRPASQQRNINKAITENSSKLKTIEDIVAFYRSDAIQSKIE